MRLTLFLIAFAAFAGFFKSVSYAAWNIKTKNYSGGAALCILAVFEAVLSILTFLS